MSVQGHLEQNRKPTSQNGGGRIDMHTEGMQTYIQH